ncbi:MAG: response regulator [Candidatus Promineifilaceae bacterium]
MVLEEIRRRARKLNLKHTEHMEKDELIRAIQVAEGKSPCFDQPWCRPSVHLMCSWRHDCHARLQPVRGLILSDDVIMGHQIATLLSSYGWKMNIVHKDRQAYALIHQGDIDVVVADIEKADLGGLAALSYAKHHWPSIMTYAIAQKDDLLLKNLARDLGGCLGFFRRVKGRIELQTHAKQKSHLMGQIANSVSPDVFRISTTG